MGVLKSGLLVLGAVGVAYAVGRGVEFITQQKNFVIPVPGKAFYFIGRYPWDGDHDDYIGELFGTISGIYDSTMYYDEIDELNDLFYGEED